MDFLDYKEGDHIIFDNGFIIDYGTVTRTDEHRVWADWDVTGINQYVSDASMIRLTPRFLVVPFNSYKVGDRIEYSTDFSKKVEDVGVITNIVVDDYLRAQWENSGYEQTVWCEDAAYIRPFVPKPAFAFQNDATVERYISVPRNQSASQVGVINEECDTLVLTYCTLTGKMLSVSILGD